MAKIIGYTDVTGTELAVLDGVTPGTIAAGKAVTVDSNKDAADARNFSATNLKAGKDAVAGTVTVFPTTTAKGKAVLACADQTGNTQVSITVAAMGQATAVGLPDPGGATGTLSMKELAESYTAQKIFAPGTTTIVPYKLQAGTNLTTAAAGAAEFDGTCFYQTAAASSRQVAVTEQFVTAQAVVSLSNSSTGVQNIFAAANDVLQLAASTTYFFEAMLYFNTGATTHTTALGFVASSAFTAIRYFSELWSTTAVTISTTAPSALDVVVSTATVLNATSTATRTTIRVRGIIRTNAASTVTPQVTFSAGPTGTCETATESFFRIWPVGTSVIAAVGNWA